MLLEPRLIGVPGSSSKPCFFALLRIKTSWSWARAIATRMKSDCFQWTTGLCVLPDSGDE
jgi:hypothetical protein